MRDRDLYARILGIEAPWRVTEVELELDRGEVRVYLGHGESPLACPQCGRVAPGYDHRPRRWRHLDTCQYRTILVVDVPRVECPEHGVHQIRVPWGEPGSRFTALFEALIIDWLQEASVSAVSRQLGLPWDQVEGVMSRAVQRGLERRAPRLPRRIGADETSFARRHEYVTVVSDHEHNVVLHVADGRGRESLEAFYRSFSEAERAAVESVAMDMWAPYILATEALIPGAERKIAFDRFHVAQHLAQAVDQVRRQEHRALKLQGDQRLKGSKYLWLHRFEHLSEQQADLFSSLRKSTLKTARAWAIKEAATGLWRYRSLAWARKAWKWWYGWAIRSRLEPIKKVARMIQSHLEGILNAVVTGVTNARAEGINAKIQWIKYTARGYRNRDRFRTAIYFHLGGLDLYPAAARP